MALLFYYQLNVILLVCNKHKSFMITQELQELHSALEEAKADIVGLWALKFLIDKVCILMYYLLYLCILESNPKNKVI